MQSTRTAGVGALLRSQRRPILTATLLVALVLRVFRLRSPHLVQEWLTDERVGTLHYSAMNPVRLFTTVPFTDTHPPLYYLLMHYWRAIFGSSLLGLRVPSVVFGTATVLGTYLLARELRNETTGLIAAMLIAISPFYVSVSQYARGYALFGLAIVFSWYFLLRLETDWNRFRATGYVVSTAVMASVHVYGGFLVIGQWAYLAASATMLDKDYPIRKLLGSQVLAAVLVSPVLLDTVALVFAHPNAASAPHLESPTISVLLASLGTYLGGQYSSLLASLALGVSSYAIAPYLSESVRIEGDGRRSFATPAVANELAVVASVGLSVVVFPVVISYTVLPMWDDVAAIGVALALSLLTALAIERLDRPRVAGGTLAVLVGLNSLIVSNYFGGHVL